MEVPQATARWIAPASLIFNFGAQIYGLVSTPNMKDVNDENISFFSPQPAMVGLFFFSQQVLQLAWLYKLFTLDPRRGETERSESRTVLSYVPYQVIGNLSIGIWVFFWNAEALKTANFFVCINTGAQLVFVVAQLEQMNVASRASVLTHLVSKTCGGISILDVLHNTSIAYFKDKEAGILVYIITAIIFGAGAVASDWILGFCLIYSLIAIAVGQGGLGNGGWATMLWIYAAITAAIIFGKNMFK